MNNEKFLNKIKQFEDFKCHAYKDSGGTWTIGWGRTAGVKPGDVTNENAEQRWFTGYVSQLSKEIHNYMTDNGYDLAEYELQALTCFVYNLGLGNLVTLTKSGKRSKEEIAKKIPEYNKCKGVVLPGLVTRREWERDLFLGKLEKEEAKKQPTAKDLQTLINEVTGADLVVDGKIGKKTIKAAYDYITEVSNK